MTTVSDSIRISFYLNTQRHPQLAYFKGLNARGARPDELIRLAIIGLKAEEENQNLLQAARAAQLSILNPQSRAPLSAGDKRGTVKAENFHFRAAPRLEEAGNELPALDAKTAPRERTVEHGGAPNPSAAKAIKNMLA